MERVIFRKFKNGEVIAILPDVSSDSVMTYMHVGQHGEGDYSHLLEVTQPALFNEYKALQDELFSIGYRLTVVKKLIK